MKRFTIHIILIIICSVNLWAQQGISMHFIESNTKETANGIARNTIKIVNNTVNTYPFLLQFNVPNKWKVLGNLERTFMLSPYDSLFIPVYMMPIQLIQGGEYAVLGAQLFSDGFLVNSHNWVLSVEKFTNWHIQAESNQIYFLHNSDTAHIRFNVINLGNADEDINLSLTPFRNKLTLYNQSYTLFEPETFTLKSGKDTVLNYNAVIRREFEGEATYNTLTRKNNKEIYSISAVAENGGEERLNSVNKENITLSKVNANYRENRFSSASLPMVVQLDAYNILEESTYLSFQAYGNKTINEVNELSYFYQTNFNSNVINSEAFLGDYFYVGYIAPSYYGELGNLVLNHEGASVSGKGIRGGYTLGNHQFGGGVVASPTLFDIEKWGASSYYKFNYNPYDLRSAVYAFYEENAYNRQRNITILPEGQWRINKNHLVRVLLGYNARTYLYNDPAKFTRNGFGTRLSYAGRFNRYSISLSGRYGSPTYEPSPGISQISAIGGYYHNNGLQSRLIMSNFSSRPEIYDVYGTLVQEGLRSRSSQIEYKISAQEKMSTISGSAYARERFYNNLQMLHEGLSVSYYKRFQDKSRISASINTDVNQFPDKAGFGSFFTTRIKTSYRIKNNILLNFRYHYGPFYYYEFSDYALTRENPQTIFLNGYYDLWMAKNRLLARFSGNYNYRLNREQHIFNSRPELFWYTQTGFRFSMYSNISYFSRQQQVFGQPENFYTSSSGNVELGFGVRKELGIPVSKKRFYDVTIHAFYDANGNGMMDKNEKGLTNVLVSLVSKLDVDAYQQQNDYKVLTGNNGMATLDNIKGGDYTIVVNKLTKGDGFYNNSTSSIELVRDEDIYLPFSSGGKIMGTLQIQKARYSRFEEKDIELGNIRIVVKDINGNEYSTLTDSKGFFKIEIPGGKFRIYVNNAAFGAGFSVQNNNVEVEINDKSSSVFVNFLVTETERKMNIKRFDSNETAD